VFRRKTTITRPDRARLLEVAGARSNMISWAIFVDELRRELARSRVVEPSRVPRDVVTMHSTVRITEPATDRRPEVLTLVYPHETDLSAGKISVLAPLGTALLGVRAGDVVRVPGAAGKREIHVDEVLYQPEAQCRVRHRSPPRDVAGGRSSDHVVPPGQPPLVRGCQSFRRRCQVSGRHNDFYLLPRAARPSVASHAVPCRFPE
jgi:regulator of nucleoside diphosphate kinase